MPNNFDLRSFLEGRRIRVAGEIAHESGSDPKAIVLVRVKRDLLDRHDPNNKFFNGIQAELAEMGHAVDFILIDESLLDTEQSVRATLLHAFEAEVRNVFLTSKSGAAVVWIDPKVDLSAKVLAKIRLKTAAALSPFGLTLAEMHSIQEATLASRMACLRIIRQIAPATQASISAQLQTAGFTIPSEDWLAERLTALTLEERLVRRANESFALTAGAIRDLGNSKGKRSPDLSRLLALAKGRH